MARLDKAAYDASRIDWNKLRPWAERVAQSTPVPPANELMLTVTESHTKQVSVKQGGFLGIGGTTRTVPRTEHSTYEKRVLGPHWVLDTRISEEDRWLSNECLESDHQTYYMVLEKSGKLSTVLHVNRYRSISLPPRGGGRKEIDSNYASVGEFTDSDVMHFDFEKLRTHWTPRSNGRWPGEAMNDTTGNRLQRHAKGVGLSIRLKELSSGPIEPRPWHNKHLR